MAEDTHAWLAANGYAHLAANSIAALCHTTAVQPASAYALRHCLIGRCRAVAEIPTDAHLSEGGTIDPARLSSDTRAAYVRLAAAVLDAHSQPLDPPPTVEPSSVPELDDSPPAVELGAPVPGDAAAELDPVDNDATEADDGAESDPDAEALPLPRPSPAPDAPGKAGSEPVLDTAPMDVAAAFASAESTP